MRITSASQLVAGRRYRVVLHVGTGVQGITVEGERVRVEIVEGTVLEYTGAIDAGYCLFKVLTGSYDGGTVEIHRVWIEENLEEEE